MKPPRQREMLTKQKRKSTPLVWRFDLFCRCQVHIWAGRPDVVAEDFITVPLFFGQYYLLEVPNSSPFFLFNSLFTNEPA